MSSFSECLSIRNSSSALSTSVYISNIAICGFNILMILLNVITNGCIVIQYMKTKSRQPVSNTVLFALSSFDLMQAVVSHPFFIAGKILDLMGELDCRVFITTTFLVAICTSYSFIMTTFVLNSERFFAIVFPMRHRVLLRKKFVIMSSLALFFMWATFVAVLQYGLKNMDVLRKALLSVIAFGLAYTVFVYIKIYFVIRSSDERLGNKSAGGVNRGMKYGDENYDVIRDKCLPLAERSRHDGVPAQNTSMTAVDIPTSGGEIENASPTPHRISLTPNLMKTQPSDPPPQHFILTPKEKKTILRMLCIVGALYLSHLPLLAFFIYVAYYGMNDIAMNFFYPWGTTLCFLSSVINPVIYCYKNEHLRLRAPRQRQKRSSHTTGSTLSN